MTDTVKRFEHWNEVETYLDENSEKVIYWLGDSQAKNEIVLKRNRVNRGDPDWDWLVIWRGVEL